ncbi:ADP-ribosylglycohydrolase family protein [Aerococcus sp. NPDC058936]|uniref:ADP-ribosylglycohydrolase family protein n=1 Tax=Aerococcus sp. NPDC058936 TaxID=3346674 RepID=UPI003672DB83
MITAVIGTQAMAGVIVTAKTQSDKDLVASKMTSYYPLDLTLDEARATYQSDVPCAGSIPVAFQAFLEGNSFEDVIRNAISVGGDSDTIASMAGAIASVYYKDIPDDPVVKTLTYLLDDLRAIFTRWQSFVG